MKLLLIRTLLIPFGHSENFIIIIATIIIINPKKGIQAVR